MERSESSGHDGSTGLYHGLYGQTADRLRAGEKDAERWAFISSLARTSGRGLACETRRFLYASTALQQKAEKRLEAEQKRRAKFRTEVNGVRKQIATGVRSFIPSRVAQVEEKVKEFLSDGDKKELAYPKMPKVYRAIL